MNCIVRTPLLDPDQKVLGYKLAWQAAERPTGGAAAPGLQCLAACVARPPASHSPDWGGAGLLFLEAPAGTLAPETLAGLRATNTVVSLTAAELAEPAALEQARVLRSAGFGLCVRDTSGPEVPEELLALVTHLEFDWGRSARARTLPRSGQTQASQPHLVASGLANWGEYQASAALGVAAFVDGSHAAEARTDGRLSPQGVLVLQLMQMVQTNVDVRHIEAALRRDPALAYQLLRYINSASFGLSLEVQSLRHAVTIMGYRPLYRWLAVLLASSNAQSASPVLMQAAVIRGRFAELLGQGMLPPREAENLFVAGMFSLLDRLLGVPIRQVLDHIQLPAAVVQALLARDGMYGPFLRLAESCETREGNAQELAESAFLTSKQVNAAHVAALAWAMDLRT